jgi:hypothetical protein
MSYKMVKLLPINGHDMKIILWEINFHTIKKNFWDEIITYFAFKTY